MKNFKKKLKTKPNELFVISNHSALNTLFFCSKSIDSKYLLNSNFLLKKVKLFYFKDALYHRVNSLSRFNSTIQLEIIIDKSLIECLKHCTDVIQCNLIQFDDMCTIFDSISEQDFLSDKEYYYKSDNFIPGCKSN